MSDAALDKLGLLLMTHVRDKAILEWRMTIDGRMKGDLAERTRAVLGTFSPDQRGAVLSLIPDVVDTVLHHLLWTLEQTDDVRLGVRHGTGIVEDVKQVSDGLPGELYSEDGWIARFSQEQE